MSFLRITLFGCVRVTHNNWLTVVELTREIQALLAYLLLQRHRVHSREVLAELFWGDYGQERARGSLNTALWKLRKALEPAGIPAGTYVKNSHSGEVSFNKDSQYWLDVEVFEAEISHILTYPFQTVGESHAVDLEKILALYKGELLEGFYEDWALRERERLRTLYLKSLVYLLQYHGFHKSYERAIAYGQQILDLDPLREEVHREMMRLYLENGQRTRALRQYEIFRRVLDEEFGISPMEDTQLLYAQIFIKVDNSRTHVISKEKISFDQAIGQLREADKAINLAKEQIQHALHLIAKYSEHPD